MYCHLKFFFYICKQIKHPQKDKKALNNSKHTREIIHFLGFEVYIAKR